MSNLIMRSIRSFGHPADRLASIIGLFMGLAGMFYGFWKKETDVDFKIISLSFSAYALASIGYQFMSLIENRDHVEKQEKLRKDIEELNDIIISSDQNNSKNLVDCLRNASKCRGEFDDDIFKSYYSKTERNGSLDNSLDKYLNSLCDTAVRAVAASKGRPHTLFECNIKILILGEDGEYYHVSRGRSHLLSEYGNRERKSLHNLPQPYLIDKNKIIYDIRNKVGDKFCIINGLSSYLKNMTRNHGRHFTYPHRDCLKYYKNSLAVPIFGNDADIPLDAEGSKILTGLFEGGQEYLGFLFIDSNIIKFNDDKDVAIMHDIAQEIYSGLRQYYFFVNAFQSQ